METANEEQMLPLSELVDAIAYRRKGKPINVNTLARWCKIGVRGIRLEARKVGGTMVTSKEAIERFLAKLNS